jgi:hypothetical protein
LLIEEQRTNLVLRSQEFDNAGVWGASNASVSANATLSPDGTTTADKITETAVTGVFTVFQSVTTTAAAHTFTVFAKAAERSFIVLYNLTYGGGTSFNLSTGAVGSNIDVAPTSSSIQSVGNGWYRCSITLTAAAASTSWRVYLASNATTISYAGTAGNGLFVYGAQLEQASFPTSYIPTVASQVTRSADVATMTGTNFSSWYNQSEGTFLLDYLATADPAGTYRTQLQARNAGVTNYNQIRNANLTPTTAITNNQVVVGTTQADLSSGTLTANTIAKTTLAYKINDFAAVTNGATPVTDVSGSVPSDLNNLVFNGAAFSVGQTWFRQIAYYNTRLPNTELQTLTAPSLGPTLTMSFTNQAYTVGV